MVIAVDANVAFLESVFVHVAAHFAHRISKDGVEVRLRMVRATKGGTVYPKFMGCVGSIGGNR